MSRINKNVKGSGGAVGLTENPSAFRRWMIAGPEQARLLLEFESQFLDLEDPSNEQHEQCYSSQEAFHSQMKNLTEAISTMGNPFLDASPELIVLDSRNCAGDAIVATIRSIENLGKSQYQEYVDNVIKERKVTIQQPIKRNSLLLFKCPAPKKSSKQKQQIANLKSDYNLFSRLYISSQFRDGDLEDFFSHENQPWPPALAEHGKLRLPSKKSGLLSCFDDGADVAPPSSFHVKVIDGPAVVHALSIEEAKTFNDYSDKVFLPWMDRTLQSTGRIDIIWDMYRTQSLKESTREKRGKGIRRKVSGTTKLPSNFQDYLRDLMNKEELFDFPSEKISRFNYPITKEIFFTSGMFICFILSWEIILNYILYYCGFFSIMQWPLYTNATL